MNCKKIFIKILIVMVVLLSCEARGGRRGGSLGGLFGGWRKYKKPSSGGGSSRRIVSSSPVHTPITKAWHENKKSSSDNFQKNFKTNNIYNGHNTPPMPTGGSYYQSPSALPGNAIYVAQAPPRGSEFGDFLTGYLTGRLLTMGFPSPHYHVTHVYRENSLAAETAVNSNNTSPVIIVNNPYANSSEKVFNAPLMEFTTASEDFNVTETNTTEANDATQIPLNAVESPVPPYGVICIPMLINETAANGENIQLERTVCYPAPAPITPQEDMKSMPVEIAGDITAH